MLLFFERISFCLVSIILGVVIFWHADKKTDPSNYPIPPPANFGEANREIDARDLKMRQEVAELLKEKGLNFLDFTFCEFDEVLWLYGSTGDRGEIFCKEAEGPLQKVGEIPKENRVLKVIAHPNQVSVLTDHGNVVYRTENGWETWEPIFPPEVNARLVAVY